MPLCAAQRRQICEQLQDAVRDLGGKPQDEGTLLATAHRMFLDLKNAVTNGDMSVINEVERGEDYIKEKYEDALKSADLMPATRISISTIYASIKADHDQMSDLKQALRKAS